MTIYHESCHCDSVRFKVDAEIDHVRDCDCAVCRRRGALIFRVPAEAMRLLTNWDALAEYRWGTMTGVDYFCRICGILPFRKPSAPTRQELLDGAIPFDGWAINVRCLEGVDLTLLPIKKILGSKL